MTTDIPTLISRLRAYERDRGEDFDMMVKAAAALEAQSTELAEVRESARFKSYITALTERDSYMTALAERDAARTENEALRVQGGTDQIDLANARTAIREALAALDDENSSHRGRVYNARAILEGGN